MARLRSTSAFRASFITVGILGAMALAGTSWAPAAAWIGDTTIARAIKRVVSSPKAERGAGAALLAPGVTATMTDAISTDLDADGKADPGDTIRYTATLAVTGETATGVQLSVPLDSKTTLVPGSIIVSPLAADESYASVGNMTLTSSSIGADCAANSLRSVTCNDTLPNSATLVGFGPAQGTANATLVNGSNTVTTANGGTVLLNADGTFVYNPAAGYEGTDTFFYTVSNAAGSDAGQVSIAVGGSNGMVWFVQAGASGTGRQSAPISLDGLRAINNGVGTNPADSDTIFVFEGTHTLTATLTLRKNQKLLGQDVSVSNGFPTITALGAPTAQSGNTYPSISGSAATTTITAPGLDGITLGLDNELAGFVAGNASRAIVGGAVGALQVRDVTVNTNGSGFVVFTSGAMTTTSPFTGFTSVTTTGGTNGVSLTAVTGTLNLGGGALSGSTGPTFIVSGGTATVTYTGSLTQGNNDATVSVLNGHSGTLNFNGAISATNGTGLQFNNADGAYTFTAAVTLNGGDAGIDILNGSAGTFTFPTTAAITNPTGIAYREDTSTANVTYNGTISKTNVTSVNHTVDINAKSGGTTDFNGLITGTTNTAHAVDLTNTGGIVRFDGGLNLTTTSGIAFNASGSGATVHATQNNSSIVNTLTSTTGIALNVVGTTIGNNGLTFRSISSDGAANGIFLQDAGTGGLTVTGNAGTCTGATPTCTGGRIQNSVGGDGATAGNGIYLSNVSNVSLTRLRLNGHANNAIFGTGVTGLVLANVLTDGNNGTSNSGTYSESAVHLLDTGGAVSITDSTLNGGAYNGFLLRNTTSASPTLALTMTGNTVSHMQGSTSDVRNTAIQAIVGNLPVNSGDPVPSGGGTLNAQIHNNALSYWWGNAINVMVQGNATGTAHITGNTAHQTSGALAGAGGIWVSGGSLTYLIQSNSVRYTNGTAISADRSRYGTTMQGTINNNTVGVSGEVNSGSATGIGIFHSHHGGGTTTSKISNNVIRNVAGSASGLITSVTGDAAGFGASGVINLTISGNDIQETGSPVNSAQHGILITHGVTSSAPGDTDVGCYDIVSNTIANVNTASGASAQNRIRVNQRFGTTSRFPGYTGAQLSTQSQTDLGIYLLGRNTASNTANANTSTGGFLNTNPAGSACPQPATPPLATNVLPDARPTFHAQNDPVPGPGLGRVLAALWEASAPAQGQRSTVTPAHANGPSLLAKAQSVIASGLRRVTAASARMLRPVVLEARSGETASATIGTIPAGKTVRVVFDATVDSGPPVAKYFAQGTFSGTNLTSVVTDDPDVSGTSNATETPGDRYNTATAVVSSNNPAFQGQSITFTATVTPTEGSGVTPDGTVQFKDGGSNLGSAVTCSSAAGNTCTAGFTTTTLATGARSITAEYSGGTNHDASISSTLAQQNTACTTNPVVINSNDTGAGSLRDAVTNACPGSTITFDMGTVTSPIGLTSDQLTVGRNVTITGPGANLLTVQRSSGSFRVLQVNSGVTATISGVTISSGVAPATTNLGGGIWNDHGILTLDSVSVIGNSASLGGGVLNDGTAGSATLTIINSSISGNTATDGGGVASRGPTGTATTTILNTTISGNTALNDGGGVFLSSLGATPLTLTNVTVTANRSDNDTSGAGSGAGIKVGTTTPVLRNTLVAGNFRGGSPATTGDDITGAVDAASANNLVGDGTGLTGITHATQRNLIGTSGAPIVPRIAALASNGGATETHALLPGSPALDAGDNTLATNASLTTDQRGTGFPRARDAADADTTQTVDIGAFEADPSIEDITDKATVEDVALAVTFNVGDSASAFNSVSATSSNVALVPNANLVVTAPTVSTRTLTATPVINASGSATITVTVTKTINGSPVSMSDTFVLTVAAVADPPSVTAATTRANLQTTSGLAITANAADGAEVTHFRISNISGGLLFQADGTTAIAGGDFITLAQGGAGLKFTPTAGSTTTGTFDVQAAIGASLTNISTATQASVTVNKHDTATAITADTPDPSDPGVAVPITYTVTSSTGGPAPTGNVVVTVSGGTETCTGTVASGSCNLTFTTSGVGRTVTASYAGDALNNGSSGTTAHTVNTCESTPVVVNSSDSGVGSLRQAIANACANATITFDMNTVTSPISLTSGELDLAKNVTVAGPGAQLLRVERAGGAAAFRIFKVNQGRTVTLSGLEISAGVASAAGFGAVGGGIYNDRGTLTLDGVSVTGNTASWGGGVTSHANGSDSSLTVINSTISGNSATNNGGGIYSSADSTGGISTLTVTNSTISGNTTNLTGGGVFVIAGGAGSARTTITSSTITGNRADHDNTGDQQGGGINMQGGIVTLRNTIVAENFAGSAPSTARFDTAGPFDPTTSFNNIIGVEAHVSGLTHGTNGNQIGTAAAPIDPKLGPLANNGGPTQTHALLLGSPAIDAGDNASATASSLTTDQRGTGFGRTRDSADANTTQTVDIGAFEADPSIEDIADKTTNEDTAVSFTFNVGDGDSAFTSITATSSNTTLLPNANAVVGTDTASTRTLTLTPALDQAGTSTVTVTVTKTIGGTPVSMSDTFLLTVNAVDDNPTLDAIANPSAILEDAAQQTVSLAGISAGGGESQALTVTAASNNTGLIPNPTVTYTSPGATGSLAYTPVANQNGAAVITVTVTDAGNKVFSRQFTVNVTAVNDQPTLTAISDPAAILEDAGAQTVNLAGITDGGASEGQTLTVTAASNNTALIPNPTVTYTSPNTTGSLSYTPVADANGSATITVTVSDAGGGTQTMTRTFTVNVTAVDDPPTLDAISNPAAINEDAGQQTVNLAGISAGANESQPPLAVTATSSNTALIPNPTVTYTSPNATGSLTYTPVANRSGSAVITVTVTDQGASNSTFSRTFTVNVTSVNDQPTLSAIANPAAIDEDAAAQTVNLAGITDGGAGEGQTLTVTATSSNTALVPNPTVTYSSPGTTGSLSYTPVANASGTATITVTVNDGGGGAETIVRTFTVTVNAVDDVPTLTAIADPAAINEDASVQTVNLAGITAGGGESQTLSVTATSNNTGLIPNPTVTYTSPNTTGSLAYTPVANQSGTAVITVTVTDTGASGLNTTARTFTVTVTAVDDVPTIDAIANPAAIDEDSGAQTVNLAGITAGGGESQTLSVTAISSDTTLIPHPTVTYTSPGTTGSLAYTPVANANGSAVITVTVTDAGTEGLNTTTRTFTVNVTSVNDAPTLGAISNPAAILEDAAAQTVPLTGITAGGGETQTLVVTATSDNTTLIPHPTVTYTSPNATGSVIYTPAANASGTATITVTVSDGAGGTQTAVRTFVVTVTAVNDAPTLNTIADPVAIVEDDLSVKSLNFAGITAGGGESQTLTVTALSSNTAIIPHPAVSYTSPNGTGSLTYNTLANAQGTAVITVTVTDNGGTSNGGVNAFSRSFTVTVTNVNDAPTISAIANQTIARWSTTGPLPVTIGDLETPLANLTLTGTSSNLTLVPLGGITFGGSAGARTVTVTPKADESGTATITVTVGDGTTTTGTTFTLTVEAGQSERMIIGLGPFPSDGGWLPVRGEAVSEIAPLRWPRLPWAGYNALNGEIHPAVGNLDSDPQDEVVVGLGAGGGGWLVVLDDAAHDYAVLKWIQIGWADYVANSDGSVWPAVGDLDGDGRAEIVAGLGRRGGGWVQIFDDALTGFTTIGWRQLGWADYNALNGEIHPAVGDVDGDGRAEIILGTGSGGQGHLEVLDGVAPYTHRRWLQVNWAGYNSGVNGPTFPAAGDLDGDGRAEIVIGLGVGGGGWLEVRDDAAADYASSRWLRVLWGDYNSANGETHPAIGNVDGDPLPEIAIGLGSIAGDGGWVQMLDDSSTGYTWLSWVAAAWQAYVDAGGPTYPAIGRLR